MKTNKLILVASLVLASTQLSACGAVGLAAGAGAAVGIASQQEGGVKSAASDVRIKAMVADNDLAVGKIVEGLSHSPFWKK